MESWNYLKAIFLQFPVCGLCREIHRNALTICHNGHNFCTDCWEALKEQMIQKDHVMVKCPECKCGTLEYPIRNLTLDHCISTMRTQLFTVLRFQEKTWIDLSCDISGNTGIWKEALIEDIDWNKELYIVRPLTYPTTNIVRIPFFSESIQPLHTHTLNWRNLDYLKPGVEVDILVANEGWLKGIILWDTRKNQSEFVLVGFEYGRQLRDREAIWESVTSENIALPGTHSLSMDCLFIDITGQCFL